MPKKLPNTEDFRSKLKIRVLQEKTKLLKKHPVFKKVFDEKNLDLSKIREHSAKLIGAGALASALLLSPLAAARLPSPQPQDYIGELALSNPQELLTTDLKSILPNRVTPLTSDEEKQLEAVFKDVTGIPAKATLEGEHLNTTFGYIGAEQHLRRYPGDTIDNHGEDGILNEGMAPGLGAWGYFAPSANKLTPDLVEKEKWYAVVQTLYLPDWQKRLPYLRDWYKYRKVLIVNTINGNAVVADIADSGPAAWTGKSFGGSPEVMDSLGGPSYKVGPVVLFFVDDPGNKIPLGPVEYNINT